ncbi:protein DETOXIFICATION 35-like [Pyrus x bretschneideri]|uniref:protein DETOXIFICATION 35-like n=1 Tax=Pyrus x bretschneideri TaxID=225117 RepID=UPI00202EDE0B|nr:protein DETOXIFICATION 35-like [Pyrus x bretschneideri]
MEEPLLDPATRGTTELCNKQLMYEGENEDYAPVRSFGSLRRMFWIETVKLWQIGGSAVITIMCMYGTNSVIVLFAGHLGTIELSAISISLSVISTFTYGFMLGMGSALETLCGQAFGAGQIHMLGIYMQRSCIILFVTAFLLLPIYIFATPILKWLGQEDDIANKAGKFTLQIIPQLFSLAINFPAQKFLQAQRKVKVLAWIAVLALVIHIGMLALFMYVFDWGTLGAAVSFNLTRWGISIAQAVYIMGWCKEGWTGFSWLAFNEIWAFVRLSLASAVMLCLEIWYMMSMLILTGGLSDAVIAVGSLSICMNVNGWETMLFVGINAAISVCVSNELGLRRPRAVKYAVYVTVSQSLLLGLLFMIIILITKDDFAVIFTSDKELQQAVAKLAYLLGITMVLNSVQPVISGVAIGGGWQTMVAYINLGCYYIFGLPLGYVLCHVANLGVTGLWAGMICGTALQTILLLIILYKTNWNKEVEQATIRVRKWGGQDIKTANGAEST